MDPHAIAMIYASTANGVGIILGLAGLGSAIGWGLIFCWRADGSVSIHRAGYRDVVHVCQPVCQCSAGGGQSGCWRLIDTASDHAIHGRNPTTRGLG